MNDSFPSNSQGCDARWQSCSDGALRELASQERARQRRIATSRFAKIVGAILLVSSVSVAVLSSVDFSSKSEGVRLSFNCAEVIGRMDAYLAGELPEAEELAVRDHLKYCQWCHRKFDERSQLRQKEMLSMTRQTWGFFGAANLIASARDWISRDTSSLGDSSLQKVRLEGR